MEKIRLIIALLATVTILSAQPKHEVRAVWLTTLGGLDWPSTYAHDGMGIGAQQRQLTDILDKLQAINVNTVLLQTRTRATTIYPSTIEPWEPSLSGKPGLSPGYDPLQFAIDECHRRGMELHAWVVTIPIGKWQSYGCQQLRRSHPSLVKRIGEEGYLNPESSLTAQYLGDICAEIVSRYDVDGIHLDYIRYPETWTKARKRQETDERRSAITHIVRTVSRRVKELKPWVKMSCSPIGKYDDLSRYRSNGWNANSRVFQDAQGWLCEGIMDQLYPMMYFQGNNFYPFAIDWQENSYGRTIVSGLGTYMLHPRERNWPLAEVERQLSVTRQIGIGHCHFRTKFLLDNVKGIYDFMKHFDRHPALVPPMAWVHQPCPPSPAGLLVNRTAAGDELCWRDGRQHSDGTYLLYNIYASTSHPVDVSKAENLVAVRYMKPYANIRRQSHQQSLYYAVTAMDRYGNESVAVQQVISRPAVSQQSSFLANNGQTLRVPFRTLFDAQLLIVNDMQGRQVMTSLNKSQIPISHLPEGMYQLRSLHRKGHEHRLGYFIIKRNGCQ